MSEEEEHLAFVIRNFTQRVTIIEDCCYVSCFIMQFSSPALQNSMSSFFMSQMGRSILLFFSLSLSVSVYICAMSRETLVLPY